MIQAKSANGMLLLASQWGWAAGKLNLPIADGPYNGTLGFAAQPDALWDGPKDGYVTLSRASSVTRGWSAAQDNRSIAGTRHGATGVALVLDEPTTSVINPGRMRVEDYRQAIRATELLPLTIREKARIEELKQALI